MGRRGAGRVPHARLRVDRQGPPAAGPVPGPGARRAAGLPDGDGGVGRPFGVPEADAAEHWWTLDNPAHHWFGLGSVAAGRPDRPQRRTSAASCRRSGWPRSSPPMLCRRDQRRSGQGPRRRPRRGRRHRHHLACRRDPLRVDRPGLQPARTSGSRSAARRATRSPPRSWRRPIPAVAKRLAALVADGGTARLWVPAARSRAEAFGPDADLRGPRDLPVLIVAPSDPAAGAGDHPAGADLRDGSLIAPVELAPDAASGGAEAGQFRWPHDLLGEGRSRCSTGARPAAWSRRTGRCGCRSSAPAGGWPSGVWIDGDRQTAPDGSSFAWQHWSHTFRYALASTRTGGGWRRRGSARRPRTTTTSCVDR